MWQNHHLLHLYYQLSSSLLCTPQHDPSTPEPSRPPSPCASPCLAIHRPESTQPLPPTEEFAAGVPSIAWLGSPARIVQPKLFSVTVSTIFDASIGFHSELQSQRCVSLLMGNPETKVTINTLSFFL